jgi:colanic acid/amylovoran biosynthesis glycosyltransferase
MPDHVMPGQYAVVHSMHLWLSQTMTWLHTQVRSLPERIESHVVCDQVANLDQFPIRNLVSADRDEPAWRFASRHSWSVARRRQRALLARELERSGARVLHSHFGDRAWVNIGMAQALAARHVVTFYGYDVGRLPQSDPEWRYRYAALFESAHLFLCEGPFMARSLEALGCPAEKVKVHHLGVNVDRIQFAPRVWRPGTPLRLLLAGSFTEKKGLPYAIEAIGRIARRVEVEVCLVGDADSKPVHQREKSRILDAVRRAGLDSRVRMLGFQTHARLFETAATCHIFLSPSVTATDGDSEGGAPVAVIEMAASGMPVVSTLHCDIPQVLENGVSGLLAPERDVDALADKLSWLVENPEAWPGLTAAARRRIESEFDAVEQGHRLASHYDRIASGL